MKKYFLVTLAFFCMMTVVHAQDRGTVSKQIIEKNNKANTKTHYNYLLLDAVNDADDFYAEYERTVQMVWDGKLTPISIKNEKGEAIRGIEDCLEKVTTTPVYQGGDAYQQAVIKYIIAVRDKIDVLETLGILGADKDSDAALYNDTSVKYTDLSNEAIDLRNEVRNKKNEYEKTNPWKRKK